MGRNLPGRAGESGGMFLSEEVLKPVLLIGYPGDSKIFHRKNSVWGRRGMDVKKDGPDRTSIFFYKCLFIYTAVRFLNDVGRWGASSRPASTSC